MALFNKEDKAEKQAQKVQALLAKYGLENLSDAVTIQSVRNIAANLAGSSGISIGAGLAGKAEDVAKIDCLKAIIEQNFIIIRQLDKLAK